MRPPCGHPKVQRTPLPEASLKGRISKTLESILLDPSARRQLREHLIHGRDGWVRMNGKTYRVHIDVMPKVKGPFGRRLAEAG